MKIVRVIARLNIGGPAHQAVLLSHRLNQPPWETLLVIGKLDVGEGSAEDLLRRYPCRWIQIPQLQRTIRPWKDLVALWKLLGILRQEKPDILHTHTAKAGTLGRLAGFFYRLTTGRSLQMVHTFHGHVLEGYFHPLVNRCFISVERWLAYRTNRLISVSHAVKQDLLKRGIGTPASIRVIPLGLNLDPYLNLPANTNGHSFKMGFVGRLVPIKNVEFLLEALGKFRTKNPDQPFQLMIVGDGELKPHLTTLSQSLGLSEQVQFAGWKRDLAEVYQSLDLVCLTSKNEGTPVSLIEALAAGRPVISTDVGGVRELVHPKSLDGKTPVQQQPEIGAHGILVPSGNREAYVQGLEWLIQQPDLRAKMGENGRSFVRRQYTIQRLVQDIKSLYQELVKTTSA